MPRGTIQFNRDLLSINANRLEFTHRVSFQPLKAYDFVRKHVLALVFLSLGFFADPQVATPITLHNRLDLPRENELVIVNLRQLKIAGDMTFKDVEVVERTDNEEKVLPSQLDYLLQDGIDDDDDEVSFLVSMPPKSSKTVTVKLLGQRKQKESPLNINQTGNGDVLVTKPGRFALSFNEHPWGGYSTIPLFLLTSEISLVEPTCIAIIRRGVRKHQKVVFHSGTARGVVVLSGAIYRHYGGQRGWDVSGYEDRIVFSISMANGDILCETSIKSLKDAVPFPDISGNNVSLNTKDFRWEVFSPREGNPDQIHAVRFNPQAEKTMAPCWGWALGTSANASMVMAVRTNQGAFAHTVDVRNAGESNYWRLRPAGGVQFSDDEKKWQVLYSIVPEKIDPERAQQMFMKLNSPLFTP